MLTVSNVLHRVQNCCFKWVASHESPSCTGTSLHWKPEVLYGLMGTKFDDRIIFMILPLNRSESGAQLCYWQASLIECVFSALNPQPGGYGSLGRARARIQWIPRGQRVGAKQAWVRRTSCTSWDSQYLIDWERADLYILNACHTIGSIELILMNALVTSACTQVGLSESANLLGHLYSLVLVSVLPCIVDQFCQKILLYFLAGRIGKTASVAMYSVW